jgi:GT2 family glycosyltransferase
VAASSGACFLVDRRAYEDVGGLSHPGDLGGPAFDLCQRLREPGKSIVAVPSSIVLGHRPALSARGLTRPIREATWQATIERPVPHWCARSRATDLGL